MKFYEITIKPLSGFGTPLKGDTIFGHFCWQTVYDSSILNGDTDIEQALSDYTEKPFIIFSSAVLKTEDSGYILRRPDIPFDLVRKSEGDTRKERFRNEKNERQKNLMHIKKLFIDLKNEKFMTAEEAGRKIFGNTLEKSFFPPHNTINRLTDTTMTGAFAPYIQENFFYHPEALLSVFVLTDEKRVSIDKVYEAMSSIGKRGFGKNSSTGSGRFEVKEFCYYDFPETTDANAFYTLAPFVPEKELYDKIYFKPFVRFGKHGDSLATSPNPFKKPVLMADEGAVLIPKDMEKAFEKPYVGQGVIGISNLRNNKAVQQGYSLYLPIKMESI